MSLRAYRILLRTGGLTAVSTTANAATAALRADGLRPVAEPRLLDGEFEIQKLSGPKLMIAQWEAAADVWQGDKYQLPTATA
jgi:hypothetical protein